MSRILVGTRKGLFAVVLADDGSSTDPALLGFLGVPVTIAFHDSRDGAIYAALDHGHFGVKLHRSDDEGATWTECGVPTYPKAADDEKAEAPALNEIWALEGAGPDQQNFVTTRILRLRGLEPGMNSGTGIDSFDRYIYIHGTNHPEMFPENVSWGCLLLLDKDLIQLFDTTKTGSHVFIVS